MILAALVRGYKCYDRSYFLPITKTPYFPYSAFVGQNGVGKSAVLESIDAFFDQRDWNINKKSKKDDVYVAPLFLLDKEKIRANTKQKELLNQLTQYFVTATDAINPQLKGAAFQELFQFRDEVVCEIDLSKHYLFLLGRSFAQRSCPYFSTFDKDLKEKLEEKGYDEKDLKNLMKLVLEHYSYVYIPVEGYVEDVLALETFEMKELMSRDILNEIDSVLTRRVDIEGKKVSLVKWLNESLDEFMDEVNDTIVDVDDSYTFKVDGSYKKNVTAQDVREQIIDAYFSIRTLKKNKKEISELSSGEQRQALIDVAYAFLSKRSDNSKTVVLAIDEPEVSLNVSRCLPQFDRLYSLVKEASCQIVFTTHWYGFLPATQNGTVSHASIKSDGVKFEIFEMPSLYDQRRRFPDDVELKSVFDFVSSIVSLVRHSKMNVLIVEGIEDYYYIHSHLRRDDVRIIPVGGVGNVVKVFNHLRPAFDDDKAAGAVAGRVVCLIDTDDDVMPFVGPAHDKNKRVVLRRLQAVGGEIELVAPGGGGRHKKTVIEDAMDAHMYSSAVFESLRKFGNEDEKELISHYDVKEGDGYSLLNHEEPVLKPKDVRGYESYPLMKECLDRYKKEIAKEYYELTSLIGSEGLGWLNEIERVYLIKA